MRTFGLLVLFSVSLVFGGSEPVNELQIQYEVLKADIARRGQMEK